jgi:hypothetical protein
LLLGRSIARRSHFKSYLCVSRGGWILNNSVVYHIRHWFGDNDIVWGTSRWVAGSGFDSRVSVITTTSRLVVGPTLLLIQWIQRLKRPECEVDDSRLTTVNVKIAWSFNAWFTHASILAQVLALELNLRASGMCERLSVTQLDVHTCHLHASFVQAQVLVPVYLHVWTRHYLCFTYTPSWSSVWAQEKQNFLVLDLQVPTSLRSLRGLNVLKKSSAPSAACLLTTFQEKLR